jgi:hypothetical protein
LQGRKRILTEKNLPVIIDGKDRLAFRTPEPARLGCLELLGADRAGKDLRKYLGLDLNAARAEEVDRIGERVLDIEELGEAKELKDLIDLRLDFQKDDIATLWLYGFQEGGKRADTGGRYIVKRAAIENEADETGFDDLRDALLEEAGIIGINVAIEE